MGEVKKFQFHGEISASKSLFNRALIVQSFFSDFQIIGKTHSEDVIALAKALETLRVNGNEFYCGDGGTTLRFLMARLSRNSESNQISGSARLMQRPHTELLQALEDLGVETKKSEHQIHLNSKGWKLPAQLSLGLKTSSQFISALLLSAWDLPEDLNIQMTNREGSYSYLDMTCQFLQKLGMVIQFDQELIRVPKKQQLNAKTFTVEPDMSSAFVVAALAVVAGRAQIENFPVTSLQPDRRFVEILKELGASIRQQDDVLIVEKSSLQGIQLNLRSNPDLFPVLAILLLGAEGTSTVTGLEGLVFKESDRIRNTLRLIKELGGEASWDGETFRVLGRQGFDFSKSIKFDTDHDHRMAMAASIAMIQGASIQLTDPSVVNKSFPDYWKVVGV